MENISSTNDVNAAQLKPVVILSQEKVKPSIFLDALNNVNPNFYSICWSDSVKKVITCQLQKIFYNILKAFGLFSYDSWECIAWKMPLDSKIKNHIFNYLFNLDSGENEPITDLWILKLKWIQFLRSRISICDESLELLKINKSLCNDSVKIFEKMNRKIIPYAGLHFFDINYLLPVEQVLMEFNNPSSLFLENNTNDLTTTGPFQEIYIMINMIVNLLQKMYPATSPIKIFNEKMVRITYEILNSGKNDIDKNGSLNIEIAANIFANYLSSKSLTGHIPDPLQLSLLLLKYRKNPEILASACIAIRNIVAKQPNIVTDIVNYLPKFFMLLSHETPKLVQWANCCINFVYKNALEKEIPTLPSIVDLIRDKNMDVASWAISFICMLTLTTFPKSQRILEYKHYVPIVLSFIEDKSENPKMLESCLWFLGNATSFIKFYDTEYPQSINPAITKYLDLDLFKNQYLEQSAKNIILFAGRCVSNLTIANGINRYTIDKFTLDKISKLFDEVPSNVNENHKISVWAICYFGTLVSNKMDYNKSVVEIILKTYLEKIVGAIKSSNQYTVNAALWSIHRIAITHSSKIPEINNILDALYLHDHHIIDLFNHSDKKIVAEAFRCFSVLCTKSQITIGVPKIINFLSTCANVNDMTIAVALRSLNTMVSENSTHSKLTRELIGKEEQKMLLKFLDVTGLTDSVCWIFGNLALMQKHIKFIANIVVPKILKFFNSRDIIIVDSICYLFCNAIVQPLSKSTCLHLEPLTEMVGGNYTNRCSTDPPTCDFVINEHDIMLLLLSLMKEQEDGTYCYHEKLIEFCVWSFNHISSNVKYLYLMVKFDIMHPIMSIFMKYPNHIDNHNIFHGACMIFEKLISSNDYVTIADEMQVFPKLLQLLDHENQRLKVAVMRCLAIVSMKNVIKSKDMCYKLGQLVIPKVSEYLMSTNLILVEQSMICIRNLILIPANRKLFISQPFFSIKFMNDFIDITEWKFERIVGPVISIFKCLSENPDNINIGEICIDNLANQLTKKPNIELDTINILNILKNILSKNDDMVHIIAKSTIPALTQCLFSKDTRMKEIVLHIFNFMSKEDDATKLEITKLIMPELISCIANGNLTIVKHAIFILAYLTELAESRKLIIQFSGIDKILNLLDMTADEENLELVDLIIGRALICVANFS